MNTDCKLNRLLGAILVCGGVALSPAASADNVPLSHAASPDVYKVLAENELFRVVLATWQPGQRDAYHSHPANAAYRLTDCTNRAYGPDDKVIRDRSEVKAGSVLLQKPIESHSLENLGTSICQVLIVERK